MAVTVTLPYVLASRKYPVQIPIRIGFELAINDDTGDRNCWVSITTVGSSDSASWYQMWEAGTAIEKMCVAQGKSGEALGIGRLNDS